MPHGSGKGARMAEQTADRGEPQETRAELERRAWELRVTHCWKTQAIADEHGVSRSTVCRMLRQENERLAREFRDQREALRVEQTEQHMAIAEQALAAWQRSLQAAETTTVTGGGGGGGPAGGPGAPPGAGGGQRGGGERRRAGRPQRGG